jgi:hypothetical protein
MVLTASSRMVLTVVHREHSPRCHPERSEGSAPFRRQGQIHRRFAPQNDKGAAAASERILIRKKENPMTRSRTLIAAVLMLPAGLSPAQTIRRREAPPPADALSVDSIIAALYGSVSHAPDASPDFERMRVIFLYVGMLVAPVRSGQEITGSDVDGFSSRYEKSA